MSAATLELNEKSLSIKQTFNAPIARVFEYFTQPELLSQWHAPGEMSVPEVDVDLQVGGKYKIVMQNPDGEQFVASGKYQVIETPNKLVYSWNWDHVDGPDTLVTVLLNELGEQTEVELIHERFADRSVTEHHSEGWTGIFVRLQKTFQ